MVRDMGLLRELLLKLEALPVREGDILALDGDTPELAVEGVSAQAINYHLALIREAGFVDSPGSVALTAKGINFRRLSWRGHEFLDTIRNPEVWRETKSGLSKIGGAGVEFAWEMAKGYAKHLAKEKLGLDVS
jgi:hypothetical protein